MKYGIKCHSTMCGITFYIIEDTYESCILAFKNFHRFIEGKPNTWEDYSSEHSTIYCDEDSYYDFTVKQLSTGQYVLVTNRDTDYVPEIIEFNLIHTFTERF